MRTFVFALLAISLWQCRQKSQSPAETQQSAAPVESTLRGYLTEGEKGFSLRLCTDEARYSVDDTTGKLDSLYRQACMPAPIPGEAVYAVLSGVLSATGDRFTVQRIDTLAPKGWRDACLPWEFWCNGTEPFWSLQISESEGFIYYKNVGDDEGRAFAWTQPKTNGKTWTYEAKGISVVIKKEKCSDGMSDIVYPYSVEVTLDGQQLRGCAVRGGEPLPEEQ